MCLFEDTYAWFYLAILSSFSLECLFIPSYPVRVHHLHYDTWLHLILESCLNKYCGSKTMKPWTFLLLCAKCVQKGYSFYGLSWNTDSKSDCDESEYECIYNISLLHHSCSPLLPTWAKWVTYSPLILPQFKYIRTYICTAYWDSVPRLQRPRWAIMYMIYPSIHPSIFQIACPIGS